MDQRPACLECERLRRRIAELEAPREPMEPDQVAAAMAAIAEQIGKYYQDVAEENAVLLATLDGA
jgi:hypothetical protein